MMKLIAKSKFDAKFFPINSIKSSNATLNHGRCVFIYASLFRALNKLAWTLNKPAGAQLKSVWK